MNKKSAATETVKTATRKTRCKKSTPNLEEYTILRLAEYVAGCTRRSALDAEILEEHFYVIDELANRLKITRTQCILLSVCLESCEETTIQEMAKYFGCANLRVYSLHEDLEALCRLHYLRHAKNYHERDCYLIRDDAFGALLNNTAYNYTPISCKTPDDLMNQLEDLYTYNIDHKISWEESASDIVDLLNSNKHLGLPSGILKYKSLEKEDILLLTFLCTGLVVGGNIVYKTSKVKKLFQDDDYTANEIIRQIEKGEHILMTSGLVEHSCADGMGEVQQFSLTIDAQDEILYEYDIKKMMARRTLAGQTSFKDITAKKLFYNESVSKQIEHLSTLLQQDKFKEIQDRLEECGTRKGFACLFHGVPGTGKTETVYQLARMAGRDIMEVNVEEIKSKWVGESESNIRAVFECYRFKARLQEVAPILLFNEADAILGIRRERAESSVDKMENSIQNIILQEMEKLEGIMIATTNLTQNLDKAFERRFIYKIKFDAPNQSVMSQIWRSMIPELSEDESLALAAKYNMSGGMIENVMRKAQVSEIITGEKKSFSQIESFCNEEISCNQRRQIGFS